MSCPGMLKRYQHSRSSKVWEDDLPSILIVMVEVIQCSDVTLLLGRRRHACTHTVLPNRMLHVVAVDLKAAIDLPLFQRVFLRRLRHLLGNVTLLLRLR